MISCHADVHSLTTPLHGSPVGTSRAADRLLGKGNDNFTKNVDSRCAIVATVCASFDFSA